MSLQGDLEAEVARVWWGQTDGAHDIWHLRRVWANCQRIAEGLDKSVDRDVLLIGSYLHDIVNVPKDDPRRVRAAEMSADHAVAWMAARGLPGQEAVAHAIRAHSYSAGHPCETLEAQVLQDADRLEALGAIGIARCFNVAGQMGAGLVHGGDPLAEGRTLDDRAYALDHFEVKLFGIAETMNTPPARQMAEERVAFMRVFQETLAREARV
ncbi:HD domain-containing protein [Tateyamaria omphalii]|uniref:HD domain-containing protein n=1 Tax=Tateyamaria omphalii TaxID=299262 RepID=UPI001C9942A7|nr:HD domain-containing protein [Tateyamaria omphalii]MBY5932888.1 HD domain-containing protein [Tateyamaria omphalii]